jgi:GNAT superfamily N-acetyltransferase
MTGAGIAVRHAGLDDLEQLAELFEAYRRFYGMPSATGRARAFLADRISRRESVVLLALSPGDQGRAIGFAQLYPSFSSLGLIRTAILNDLFVAPRWRRLGAAIALLRAAVDHAARHGVARLELATRHENHASLRLYHAMGWQVERDFAHLTLTIAHDEAQDGTARPLASRD